MAASLRGRHVETVKLEYELGESRDMAVPSGDQPRPVPNGYALSYASDTPRCARDRE